MKTKFTLFLLICITIVSCSKSSGKDDDDEIVLTESNYVFEGDLYKEFLAKQIDSLTIKKNYLQSIIDNNQGDQEMLKDLIATTTLINETVAIEMEVPDLASLISKFGKRLPPRIGPRPGVTPIDLVYVVFYDLKEYQGAIFDGNNKNIGRTASAANLIEGTDGKLFAVKIEYSEILLSGTYMLKSDRMNLSGNQASYTNELSVIGKK